MTTAGTGNIFAGSRPIYRSTRDGMMGLFLSSLSLLASIPLGIAVHRFLKYNRPIIQRYRQLAGFLWGLVVALALFSALDMLTVNAKIADINTWDSLLILVFVVVWFLGAAVIDYFQPLSLYDDVINPLIVSLIFLALRTLALFTADTFFGVHFSNLQDAIDLVMAAFVFVLIIWGTKRQNFTFLLEDKAPIHLFQEKEGGYAAYRIPSLSVIPEGSQLANGDNVEVDTILAMAEARKRGSLDDGFVNLVLKRSVDQGQTWSDMSIVRTWERLEAKGKIGNPTPVFDAQTGRLFLFHIAGEMKHSYTTWLMTSDDGGVTFSAPVEMGEGIVGPGHGLQLQHGEYTGRLVVPTHNGGLAYAWLSDDHGETWRTGEGVSPGDESEIVELSDGRLLSVVRGLHGCSKPHGDLHQMFSISEDGGETWGDVFAKEELKTPICQASLAQENNKIYFSYPDEYHSRCRVSVAVSEDDGETFTSRLVYPGPAGYSQVAVLSDGTVMMLFENGSVEYDQRITLVKLKV